MFLSAFGQLYGYSYLKSLVQPLIDAMAAMPPGVSYAQGLSLLLRIKFARLILSPLKTF